MNREDYQKVKKIFQSALDVALDERAEFLNEKCSDNPNIRREVEKLLDSFDSDYLEQPAVEKFAETVLSKSNLSTGQKIGHYCIVKKIGAGGMGEVFLAEDVRLKRKIALKILPVAVSQNKNYLRRFEQEACAASALNHPNILTVHEFGDESGTNFIATEFVEGKTLRERLSDEPIDSSETLDIVLQVAAALVAAHEAGIIHRDIKPENIMIRADGLVKVLDFGLAKLTLKKNEVISGEDTTQINTTPGMIMGTASYMSPEQARGKKTDARSDVWSLGVVLYEILAGGTPFEGETTSDKIASILTREPAPMDENIPAELHRILRKTLQKKLDARYQTVRDLLLDLKEIKTELEFQGKLERSNDPVKREAKTQTYKQTETAAKTIHETAPEHTFQAFTARYSFYFQTAFVALIAIVGVSIWWFAFGRAKQTATTDSTSAGSFTISKITNWVSAAGETATNATFSHDGKFITFNSTKSGTSSIWVKQTNTGDAIQVTKDEFYNSYPVFSPDAEEIVYYSSRGNSRGLWRVSLMGGQSKLVTENIDKESSPKLWSKSGKIYFQNYFNLFAVDAESGEVSAITDFPSPTASANIINISADESQLAFIIYEDASYKIKVKPVNSPETRQILESKTLIANVIWHPDGKTLIFSQVTGEFYQIYSIGLDGGEPVQISFGDSDFFVQDVSPNGNRVLFSSSVETADLWKIDKEDAKESLIASQIDIELWADVSPTGDAIVYQSIRNRGNGDLLKSSIMTQPISNDGNPLQLAEEGFLPNWSPDGKTVAFLKKVEEHFEIWKVSKTGDLLKPVSTEGILELEFYRLSPYLTSHVKHLSWSPKSSGLAFPAVRNGISNIWLAPADGSGERKISDNQNASQSFYCPLWLSDETGIAFSSRTWKTSPDGKDEGFIWFYDIATNTQRKILESEESVRLLGWTKSEDELIFAASKKIKTSVITLPEIAIRAVSVKTGKVRNLTIIKDVYFQNIYLSPDKQSVGFTSRSSGNDNVWISSLEGGEPRKLTGNNDPRLYFSSLAWSPDNKTIYFGKQTRFTLLSMLINQKVTEEKK